MLLPSDLAGELGRLRIGKPVVEWYQEEIARLRRGAGEPETVFDWETFEREFLKQEAGTGV